ncbi:MAG: SAM-dependent methyltransferase, partial [Tepidiformaceae bacterium]
PAAAGEASLAAAREGHLAELFDAGGLRDIVSGELTVNVGYDNFEGWWDPFTLGVGPAGAYVAGLQPSSRAELREACRGMQPPAPFVVSGRAWAARGTV